MTLLNNAGLDMSTLTKHKLQLSSLAEYRMKQSTIDNFVQANKAKMADLKLFSADWLQVLDSVKNSNLAATCTMIDE